MGDRVLPYPQERIYPSYISSLYKAGEIAK